MASELGYWRLARCDPDQRTTSSNFPFLPSLSEKIAGDRLEAAFRAIHHIVVLVVAWHVLPDITLCNSGRIIVLGLAGTGVANAVVFGLMDRDSWPVARRPSLLLFLWRK